MANYYGRNTMLDRSAVDVLEAFLGTKLPSDYGDYLLANNGGTPDATSFDIPGEGDDSIQYFFPLISKTKTDALPYKIKLYKERTPEEMLPIGCDPGGNLILLSLKGKDRGKVFFWDHDFEADDELQPYYENIKLLAPSFKDFLTNLKP